MAKIIVWIHFQMFNASRRWCWLLSSAAQFYCRRCRRLRWQRVKIDATRFEEDEKHIKCYKKAATFVSLSLSLYILHNVIHNLFKLTKMIFWTNPPVKNVWLNAPNILNLMKVLSTARNLFQHWIARSSMNFYTSKKNHPIN